MIIEVLNDVVIPLLNKIEEYENRCQERSISTLPIDVKLYAKSNILYKRFVEFLKKYHYYYEEFQREVNEFNHVQQSLQQKVDTLKSALANILQKDKHIHI